MTPEQVAAIDDPVERARTAQEHLRTARQQVAAYLEIRDAAMVALRTQRRMTQRAVAALLGLSPGLIAQVDATHGVTTERTTTAPPTDRSTTA